MSDRNAREVADDVLRRFADQPQITTTFGPDVRLGDWFRVILIQTNEDETVVTLVREDRQPYGGPVDADGFRADGYVGPGIENLERAYRSGRLRKDRPRDIPDENAELLRRLDAWRDGENAGPLIRWAAAHLRGELI